MPSNPYYFPALTHGTTGDFAVEIGSQFTYFARRFTGRPQPAPTGGRTLEQAFGVEEYEPEKEKN